MPTKHGHHTGDKTNTVHTPKTPNILNYTAISRGRQPDCKSGGLIPCIHHISLKKHGPSKYTYTQVDRHRNTSIRDQAITNKLHLSIHTLH